MTAPLAPARLRCIDRGPPADLDDRPDTAGPTLHAARHDGHRRGRSAGHRAVRTCRGETGGTDTRAFHPPTTGRASSFSQTVAHRGCLAGKIFGAIGETRPGRGDPMEEPARAKRSPGSRTSELTKKPSRGRRRPSCAEPVHRIGDGGGRSGPHGRKNLVTGRAPATIPAAMTDGHKPGTGTRTDSWVRDGRRAWSGGTERGGWGVGYPPASMTMRPPTRTWMLRSCLSSKSIPTSGVLPVASALLCLGWPSQRTVTS